MSAGAGAAIESGLRGHRTEFAREAKDAENNPIPASDPDFQYYSDTVRSVELGPGVVLEAQRGLGDVDPTNHFKAPEEPTLTVTYDLQRWFVDGAGDPNDAAYDGLARSGDGRLPNTHTFIDRQTLNGIAETNTVDGASGSRDTRIYAVGIGGYVDGAELIGDPGEQQPVSVELTYEFVQERVYQVDQPSAGTQLAIQSTSVQDDSQQVVVEADDAGPAETLALNGTTVVPTTATTFDSIDAIYVTDGAGAPVDHVGTIQVYEYDGIATGALLAELNGSEDYDDVEGDSGIPALGAGSRGSTIGTSYETFIGDTVTDAGSSLAFDINSAGITVSNNTERTVKDDSFGQRITSGTRDTEVSATVLGETESHDKVMRALTNTGGDIVWTFDGGTITVANARLTDPGSPSYESEQNSLTLDNTFTGEGLTIA